MALQSLILPIVSIFRSMGLNSARQALAGITKDFSGFAKQVGMAAGSFAAFSALTTARQFTVEAVEATQRFERNILALNQVFEDAAPQIRAFSKEVENYGLSQSQAAQASVFLGSVLKQYGFTTAESANQTENLVRLAQDLATTYGYDVQEALLAITALFRGEYDPIEKFGVAMKQNEINAELAARGLGDLTGAAEMQAAAQIRLELLFERGADSIGAFTRATDTLYGSQQRLNAVMGNLQVAFGEPLQGPLAEINNLFADLAQQFGPDIVEIGKSIGNAIEGITPTIDYLGRTVLELVSTTQQAIDIVGGLAKIGAAALAPAIVTLNGVLGTLNGIMDATSAAFGLLDLRMRQATKTSDETAGSFLKHIGINIENENTLESWVRRLDELLIDLKAAQGEIQGYDAGAKSASVQIRVAANAQKILNLELEKVETRLQNATEASIEYLGYLQSIGASVGFAEFEPLDRGDGTDYVGDFFRGIEDAVKKESARIRLLALGASEGLVDAILGAQGWEQVFKRVIRDGAAGLQELQEEFNKTAAGIAETTKALQEKRKAAQEAYDALLDDAEKAYSALERQKESLESLTDQIRDYGASLVDLGRIDVLATITDEIGEFESQIVGAFNNIRSSLSQGYIDGNILEQDYFALSRFVDDSVEKLSDLARQRDELAQRYSLAEALIGDYRAAFTSAAKLTGVLDNLKAKTEEVTVKEVMTGVSTLGANFREFGVTIEREYTEKIEETINKSEALVDHFRDIAEKARTFAANLRQLREMGLDPMLFNQLVEAGVEAGGETAQALVDGGDETISELNSIFQEIDALGSDLGEDVASTLYGSGIDMADGLLEGIRSKQSELEMLARDMADAFNNAFQANVTVAIENAVGQAAVDEINLDEAKAALETQQRALGAINEKIANAQRYIKNINDDIKEAGATEKLGEYIAEQTRILDRIDDLTSMIGQVETFGPTPMPVTTLGSGSPMTTFNVTVNAGMGTDGSQIGEQIVNEIIKFERSSGQVFIRTT